MVALVIAAVGSFVSCKDYDDDINNLQKQIDAKAAISELTALQSTLESKISTATAAAQKAAEDAAAKADASLKSTLEAAIADAKKAGTDAGTQAGTAIAAANKAQETADGAAAAAKKADEDAKAALADALKTIEETYQTKAAAAEAAAEAAEALAAVKTVADAAFTKAEAEKLQEQVNNLKSELEAAIDEKIDAKIQEVNNAVASVDAIWAAITSIELVNSWSNYFHDEFTLNMLHGEQVNGVFGNEAYKDADELIKYVAGDSLKFNNRIIVRVNPANATIAKEDIHLINSKGESLDDLVNVTEVKDFTGLITRGDYATGLKQITFVRNDAAAATDAAFGEATQGKKTVKKGEPATGDALFAITVNNTKDAAANRFASTTFDIVIAYGWYQPADDFDFTVKGDGDDAEPQDIADLRNRWTGAKTVGEDETAEVPSERWPGEYVWQNINGQTAPKAPAAEYTLPSISKVGDKTANVKYGDVRNDADALYIEVAKGGHFTISGINTDKIDYYYVALDKQSAVESAPSEWEAWNGYSYEGLLEMTPSTEDKVITISSEAAEGDIIGFRVYAVNYDGTLADPDGKAFYVKVGETAAPAKTSLDGHFTAVANGEDAITDDLATAKAQLDLGDDEREFNVGINEAAIAKSGDLYLNGEKGGFEGEFEFTYDEDDENHTIYAEEEGNQTVKGYYWLLTSKKAIATKVSDVAYILTSVDFAGQWRNGVQATADLVLQVKDPDHHDAIVENIVLTVTKDMPDAPSFKWNASRGPVNNVLTVYPEPAADFETALDLTLAPSEVSGGRFNIAQYSNIANDNYTIKVTKPAKKSSDPAVSVIDKTAATKYVYFDRVDADANKVAHKAILNTEYDATLAYTFKNISTTWNGTTKTWGDKVADYDASVASAKFNKIKFVDALDPDIQHYAWNSYNYVVGKTANANLDEVAQTTVKSTSQYFVVWGDEALGDKLLKYSSATGESADKTKANISAVGETDIFTLLNSINDANMQGGGYLYTQSTLSVDKVGAWYLTYSNETGFPFITPTKVRYLVVVTAGGTEYYKASINGTSGKLIPVVGSDAYGKLAPVAAVPPAENLDGLIEIYATDAFGLNWDADAEASKATKPIASLPIKLYKNLASVQR